MRTNHPRPGIWVPPSVGDREPSVGDRRQTLRRNVVFHQLDDLNALADALATASYANDATQVAALRVSMARYAVALDWNQDATVSAILAYLDEHKEFDDDLFGPAFILSAIAPDQPATAALLARLPEPVRALLSLATPAPPRP